MRGHVVPPPAGDLDDRGFQRRVLERLDPPARVADEMMVMVSARIGALEPRDPVAQIDALHEPELVQAVEGAIDARDPDSGTSCSHAVMDLLRRETTVLAA